MCRVSRVFSAFMRMATHFSAGGGLGPPNGENGEKRGRFWPFLGKVVFCRDRHRGKEWFRNVLKHMELITWLRT